MNEDEFTARDAADLLSDAKSQASSVLRRWSQLSDDIDASSGELEQAIQLLGRVTDDLEEEA